MWGALNIFGKKKDTDAAETVPAEPVMEAQPGPQPATELAVAADPAAAPQPEPVYAPSPWDEFGADMAPMEAGVVAHAGQALEPGTKVADQEAVATALKTVYDPEIPVDIYELGLIYEINMEMNGDTRLVMTLTAPGCPVAGILPQQVADAAASVDGVGEVEVTLVWDPPWDPDKMSEDAKLALGMF
jgi:FeS assembly SUF system protein